MLIIIDKPARRACAVCHVHKHKDGFFYRNQRRNTEFRCDHHLLVMFRQEPKPFAIVIGDDNTRITLDKPGRRACVVCHSHDHKNGFFYQNQRGNGEFRCGHHLMLMFWQTLSALVLVHAEG